MTDRLAEPLAKVLRGHTKAMAALGLETVEDLLRHYPRRYAEPGRYTDLGSLRVGEPVTVVARIAHVSDFRRRSGAGFVITTRITDDRHSLEAVFFPTRDAARRALLAHLRVGRSGLFTGKVGLDRRGERTLVHPKFTPVGADDAGAAVEEATRPIPLYPATERFDSQAIQRAVRAVLDPLTEEDVPDPIPPAILAAERLPGLLEALRLLHRPEEWGDWRPARARLRFEEALLLQVALARRRAEVAHLPATPRPVRPGGILEAFEARLPFTLTAGQRAVGAEVAAELARAEPMQRLLQGEVGSGKTVVALRAMLQVVDAGGQAALLAPTEVLAAQHLRSVTAMLGPFAEAGMLGGAEVATRVALLTGSQGAAARRKALLDAVSGAAGIVIGTHALLSEDVQFADLGLVVVDEQHRFGVEQRDALRAKADGVPHLLVMTATPIPRTVAMTVFGDLEVSTLREIPAGRSGVVTHVVPADNAAWLSRVWARAREEVAGGHRVFVVCPRISADEGAAGLEEDPGFGPSPEHDEEHAPRESGPFDEDDDGGPHGAPGPHPNGSPTGAGAALGPGRDRPLSAVLAVAEDLAARAELSGVSIGILHGRQTPEEKDRAMARFQAGDLGVLVSTTVIEVGVDVPEASMMVVLDADRFGISQLHQLRGRVGRGSAPGLCLLVSAAPPGSPAGERLSALAASSDGFELAHLDLRQRREGDVLGAAQSGRGSSLRLLRVIEDADVIARAREVARRLVAADPALTAHPALARALDRTLDPEREEFLGRT